MSDKGNIYKLILKKCIQLSRGRFYSYKSVRRPDNIFEKLNKNININNKYSKNNLTKFLQNKIKSTGPITIAEYMREVLIHPSTGYYMNRDVFGADGDFITSPEISQIFGEIIAIWIISEWRKIGSPTPFQLVELGPGRGTLALDILRVLTKFGVNDQFSIHFVEISPFLSELQAQRLCYKYEKVTDDTLPYYQIGTTATNVTVHWYKQLEDVPHEFSIVLAHEFFDTLPIHKLQLVSGVWKEILIDVCTENNKDFRFVISKSKTPITQFFKPIKGETRTNLEYSIEIDRIISILVERLESDGGIGLIIDYGHFGEKTDTLRAFKNHKLHDVLKNPGSADLTADVDFRQLKHVAEQDGKVFCCGPVDQGYFLKKMEGHLRLEQLLKYAQPENRDIIKSGYAMLTEAKQMGERFKFLALFPTVLKDFLQKFPINGFN